jgi:hypothetical protein
VKLRTLIHKVSVELHLAEISECNTYSRLLCSLSAIGASGCMIVSQALGTLTPMIAFRLTFLKTDFEPRVATNLEDIRISIRNEWVSISKNRACGYATWPKMEGGRVRRGYQFRRAEVMQTREEGS